jgi:hypothetical protein
MNLQQANKALVLLLLFTFVGLCNSSYAQVGINTKAPAGILDVNSGTYGLVLPRIALTATNVEAPVINPQGGGLAVGTVVYNTNATTTGANDVYKGVYVWEGTKWVNKFTKKHAEFNPQTSFYQTSSTAGYQNVPGLTSKSFVAQYTGVYKIEVSMNYGAGYIVNASTGTDVGVQEGMFRFTFDGTNYLMPAKTNASRTDTGTNYYAIWEQFSIVEYVTLTAGASYSYNLAFDQYTSPGFVNNGDSGTGMGYIGIPDHVPCSVEFIYIGD